MHEEDHKPHSNGEAERPPHAMRLEVRSGADREPDASALYKLPKKTFREGQATSTAVKNARLDSKMIGSRFERLIVLERYTGQWKGRPQGRWRCLCVCGRETIVTTSDLAQGKTRSCGCLQVERSSPARLKYGLAYLPERKPLVERETGRFAPVHGMSKTVEFETWASMRMRCSNPKHRKYPDYGAKGITVCKEWDTSFETFYRDMGPRPSPGHSIDRIDTSGNYEPSNCRWATKQQQTENRGYTRWFTKDGLTLTLAQWAAKYGLQYGTLYGRIFHGKSLEEALSMPVRSPKR